MKHDLEDENIIQQIERITTMASRPEYEEIQKIDPPDYHTMMRLNIRTWKINVQKVNIQSWLEMSKEAIEIFQFIGPEFSPLLDTVFIQLAKVGLILIEQPWVNDNLKKKIYEELKSMSELLHENNNYDEMVPHTEILRDDLFKLFASENSENRSE